MNGAAWEDYPGAPRRGSAITAAENAPAVGQILSLDLGGYPVLLIGTAEGLRAYVNACPHQYLPLDWRSDRIVSPGGTVIRCSNHDWGFDAKTGAGQGGDAEGCALDPIPVHVAGGCIVIGEG